MNVWRVVAHHEDPQGALEWSMHTGRIAVGWGSSGDLREMAPSSATVISRALPSVYPDLRNSQLGGPSLWNFFAVMGIGDQVIISDGKVRVRVVEITGDYFFAAPRDSFGDYRHQRAVVETDIDPDALWVSLGSGVEKNNNIRWTVALCGTTPDAENTGGLTYSEGSRCEVTATVVERNPKARSACLQHHGYRCVVCDMDFSERYGKLGERFIHVHHLTPLAGSLEPRQVDPITDLIPICPNCHAMIHRTRPPLTIDVLKGQLSKTGTR